MGADVEPEAVAVQLCDDVVSLLFHSLVMFLLRFWTFVFGFTLCFVVQAFQGMVSGQGLAFRDLGITVTSSFFFLFRFEQSTGRAWVVGFLF